MSGSVSEYRGLGLGGGEYINDTAVHTGNWFAVQMVGATILQSQSSNIVNLDNACQPVAGGKEFADNRVLYGHFTSIELTSGAVLVSNI
jgi:hypothetical protein